MMSIVRRRSGVSYYDWETPTFRRGGCRPTKAGTEAAELTVDSWRRLPIRRSMRKSMQVEAGEGGGAVHTRAAGICAYSIRSKNICFQWLFLICLMILVAKPLF